MDKKKSEDLVIANKELAFQNEEKEKRAAELVIANKELVFQNEEKEKRAEELVIANKELAFQNDEKEKRAEELIIADKELVFQNREKKKRAEELVIADKELAFQNEEKEKRAAELIIANKELVFQNEEKEKRAAELIIANEELVFQNEEKEKRAAELIIANKELVFQNEEKEKRAAELIIANKELVFQNEEKEKRAAELIIANKELVFQNEEKEKRAEELIIANKELAFQNKEKEKRAAELGIANIELAFQNEEKEKRAAELDIANKELVFQNEEKEKRAAEKEKRAEELIIANKELAFQNKEKEKRAAELGIANIELAFQNQEKEKRAAELDIANKELVFQNVEKEKRAAEKERRAEELIIANKELAFQNKEKEKRAAELGIANIELAFQNEEKEKRAAELDIANKELVFQNAEKEKRAAEKGKRAEELIIANKELAFQNKEKEKRAAELGIANIELAFQNAEKENRAADLIILSGDLKAQQEELRKANDELIEKAHLLEKQKEEVEQINKEVEKSRHSLEDKAEQLTLTSKYKSEFLANISHELRTPLNSLLILAQQLVENHERNLSEKQIRYAKTIHSCGNDLIYLINDILDFSKIESGVISVDIMPIEFSEIVSFVETTFRPIAETKNFSFKIEVDENLPDNLETDIQRLAQILKNLLSNAFKFTEKGEVKLSIHRPSSAQKSLVSHNSFIVFSVEDTGIGISDKTQPLIFEAFQQAEGSTSRKFGGTGLGLSISKGFAELLGGAIRVESELGKGSNFSLYLPLKYKEGSKPFKFTQAKQLISSVVPDNTVEEFEELGIDDDRSEIKSIDKVVMIIEDDLRFTHILMDRAHDCGLKAVVAINYLDIFECIQNFKPIAITLDVNMPESNGWNILKLLKSNIRVRHIPVHVISGVNYKSMAKDMGAKSAHVKPISAGALDNLFKEMITFNTRKLKKVLLVNPLDNERVNLTELLNNVFISTTYAISANEALTELKTGDFDCVIIDFGLPDVQLLLKFLKTERSEIPLIVFSKDSNDQTDLELLKAPNVSILQKNDDFYGKLLNEVLTQMHVNTNSIDEDKIHLIETAMGTEDILDGKKVLIVDDDVRNLFALTAAFERSKLEVLTADSGMEALQILENDSQIDIVLMDIMMPDMDGYEAIQLIRKAKKNKQLPVIAVTAKAMAGDRKKCIDSGASDYITKPVKTDQILSLMRVWLYKQELV
jgi:signal transduction histidine kinase/CheY-like chemotaxis protein